MEKLDKVKAHLKANRKVYVVAVSTAAVTATVTTAIVLRITPAGATSVVRQINYKSNPVVNQITTNLVRRGHPGKMIQVNETGEVFASIRRACEALEINSADFYRYMHGSLDSVKGKTFTILGDAL